MIVTAEPRTPAPRSTPAVTDVAELVDITRLLTDEERQFQATVRRFADERLRPLVGEAFERGRFPAEVVPALGELGVLGMHLEGYGCAGAGAVAHGLACLELEAVDSSFRSFVSVQGSLAMFAIATYGSAEQRQAWLPRMARGEAIGCFGLTEPDVGSDPAAMATRARRDGGDWVLSGTKLWITNGSIADVAVVWARTDEGVRGFLVPCDSPGFRANDIPAKLSLRVSVTSELVLDEVRIPADAALPEAIGLRAPLSCLAEARFGIVFGSMGAARDCLAAALAYAGEREQFGRPIAGFQLTQAKLVDMAVELSKGLLLAVHLGRLKEAGALRPEQVSVGKLNNVREALQIARTCRTIFGGAGITLDHPPLRHASNLESVLTYEGTSEIHTLVVGEALTGWPAYRG